MKSSKLTIIAFALWGLAIALQVVAFGYRLSKQHALAPPGRIEAKEAVEGAELDVKRSGSIDGTRYVVADSKLSVAPHWYLYVRRGGDVACYEVPQPSYEAVKVGDQAPPLFDDFGFRRVDASTLKRTPAKSDGVPDVYAWFDYIYDIDRRGK